MKLIKESEWNHFVEINQDGYGSAVVRFAERWADMMEQDIEAGYKLWEIAKQTSIDADTEGITGFMYGCAVQILSDVWVYGEELRQWHNGRYGHSGDGVVNPAVLTISI